MPSDSTDVTFCIARLGIWKSGQDLQIHRSLAKSDLLLACIDVEYIMKLLIPYWCTLVMLSMDQTIFLGDEFTGLYLYTFESARVVVPFVPFRAEN